MRKNQPNKAGEKSLLEMAKKELAREPADILQAGRERDAYYVCDGEDKRDILETLFQNRDA